MKKTIKDTKTQMNILDFEDKVQRMALRNFPNSDGDNHTLSINIIDKTKSQVFHTIPVQRFDTIKRQEDFDRALELMAHNISTMAQANGSLLLHLRAWQKQKESE